MMAQTLNNLNALIAGQRDYKVKEKLPKKELLSNLAVKDLYRDICKTCLSSSLPIAV